MTTLRAQILYTFDYASPTRLAAYVYNPALLARPAAATRRARPCWLGRLLAGAGMLLAAFRLLAYLPLPLLHALGRMAGRIAYAVSAKYRRQILANAHQAGYPGSAFARRAAAQAGAMIMELPKVWLRTEQSLAKTHAPDTSVLDEALAQGRGILFLTPHLGCFEITAHYLSRFGPLTVMYRPPRKAILAPVMELARNTPALHAVPASLQGVREFIRALKRGEAVGMLPDQAPAKGEGIWAPFFGRPAYTMTLPGRLATQTGVAVILVACQRLERGKGWRIHYMRLPQPLPSDPLAQATLINHTMQTLIQRFPEQYLWSYKRYKTPRGAPPPPLQPPKS